MKRPFSFNATVKLNALLRQHSLCAGCQDPLTFLEEHAHHVVPAQAGHEDRPANAWLRTVDNCVILCATCHMVYHGYGRFATVAAEPGAFTYSHGNDRAAHEAWVRRVSGQQRMILPQAGKSAGR